MVYFPADTLLTPGQLLEVTVGGGTARLTLPRLAKDDEGLYTLRIFTKDGTAEHSAYLFVSGRTPPPLLLFPPPLLVIIVPQSYSCSCLL